MAATGAAQLRPKPGLFLWGHFDDNLGGHGRFSSAVRLMGVVPVSLNETAAALNPLLLCPISLWTDLELGEFRALVVLSEQLHFGRAAAKLHVSQPALTKQIKR